MRTLVIVLATGLLSVLTGDAGAQAPKLPGLAPPAPAGGGAAAPGGAPKVGIAKDGETIATASGPIKVEKRVSDQEIRRIVRKLLPKYPGVRWVGVEVEDGAVTLTGQVDDDDSRDEVTKFVQQVEGVDLVINRMKTDIEVMSARQLVGKVLGEYWGEIRRKWLLALLALAMVAAAALLARLFGRYSEALLAPFVRNELLRSVVGSFIGSLLVFGGVMLALYALDLTHAVLSILGLAGMVGLAVGFAFRDITENFIASVLLGVRRPFRVGDYIQVAGQAGVVQSLNTRATVLVTLEGNHVRIPNGTIYKEIMVNSSASSSSRGSFDVVIPYEVSTATALEAMTRALREQEGILAEPPARALVAALEPGGVRLRTFFWMPTTGVDGDQLQSDVRLRVKVALQQAGITPPPTNLVVSVAGRVPVQVSESDGPAHAQGVAPPGSLVSSEQARANLLRDTRAAEAASELAPSNGPTPIEHVLSESSGRVADEGANLLKNGNGAR